MYHVMYVKLKLWLNLDLDHSNSGNSATNTNYFWRLIFSSPRGFQLTSWTPEGQRMGARENTNYRLIGFKMFGDEEWRNLGNIKYILSFFWIDYS